MDPNKLLEKIKDIRNNGFYDVNILIKEFAWNQAIDIRITSLSKYIRLLIGLHLSFHSLIELSHQDDVYWSQLKLPNRQAEDSELYTECFELFIKIGFVASIYSVVESSFRIYFHHLDPESYERKKGNTAKLFEIMFLEKLDRKYNTGFQRVRLLGHIRNSLHNNGVFSPRDMKQRSIEYKGVTYTFTPGEMIDFAAWELILDLTDDMRSLLFQVATDKNIKETTTVITDWSRQSSREDH